MRCFVTADGRVLVEWALAETDVLKPDRTPLGQAGTFYLFDTKGDIARSWTIRSVSVQEHLGTSAYVIEGDALVDYYHDAAWGHEHEPSLNRTIELEGLRSLPPAQAPSETTVRQAIERYDAARRKASVEHERVENERLARFERALPELGADERITLVWRYAGDDVVIYRSTGEEVWRESDWPWMGKDLYRRLRNVAEKKYEKRLARFEVDVPRTSTSASTTTETIDPSYGAPRATTPSMVLPISRRRPQRHVDHRRQHEQRESDEHQG